MFNKWSIFYNEIIKFNKKTKKNYLYKDIK